MTVWIVDEGNGMDDWGILGVYQTREAAIKAHCQWRIGPWPEGNLFFPWSRGGTAITEYEVKE